MNALFAPVDISFLVFFRVFLGSMMLWTVWDFFDKNFIASCYIAPPFHFTYHGFAWVRPWPGDGMYVHFAALAMFSVFVTIGFFSRLSAVALGLGFTFVFLLEKAVYLNHHYLMCLLCLLLGLLPAGRAWSVDTLLRPQLWSDVVPAWTLWLLRFQIGLPYVYGGIAKLQADWLQGQPMQMWLSISVWHVLLGHLAEERWLALLFSWGGLLFDLGIVPFLLWRRTRWFAFGTAVVFHLLNAFMFDIGVFPWLMIGATTVFLDPDWPRRLVTRPATTPSIPRMRARSTPSRQPAGAVPLSRRQKITVALLVLSVLPQLVLPLRHLLYPGNVLWTEDGYLFSWHMMLRAKVNALGFRVTDCATGQILPTAIERWLTPQQIESMGHDPEMMREFACWLRHNHLHAGQDVEVRVLALSSLNGRKPQLLVDPTADLSRQQRSWCRQTYVVPLTEPFRSHAWNVPVAEWDRHLTAPQHP